LAQELSGVDRPFTVICGYYQAGIGSFPYHLTGGHRYSG
jgi:hypothetical protein